MKIIKKIVFSFFFLYSFNVIAVKFNIIIPINIFTLSIITLFDVPGIIMLFLSMFLIF